MSGGLNYFSGSLYCRAIQLPADKEIRALHEKHAPSREAFDLVYTHCEIVCGIAEQLFARSDHGLDVDLVRAGSLLVGGLTPVMAG
jgi:uncharacterized protein